MTQRLVSVVTATIDSGEALSDVIDFRGCSFMQLEMPADWTAADIGFHSCSTRGGTFAYLQDDVGTRVEVTSVGATDHVQIQAELAGSAFLKIWSQNAGASENQGAERQITVVLKT